MRMKCGTWVWIVILVGLGFSVSCSTNSSSSSGTGALYVTTQGDALVSLFSVDLNTGSITANGTGIATGTTPSAMILTPSGDAAFVANRLALVSSSNFRVFTRSQPNSPATITAAAMRA